MSILNGIVCDSLIYPETQELGNIMTPVSVIDEPSVSVAAYGDDMLVCGGQRIALYRIADDGSHTYLSSVKIYGKARQIAVKDSYAYVSARECGLYVCDLRDTENPKIVYNLDTIEFATGVAIADNILAVTNRHMGCELFDISNPALPMRVAHFLCGEAQSVCLFDKYAVIGDWMNKRARIFDISDTSEIKELSCMRIDGFADGVCTFAREGRRYCVVGSGHHSEKLQNRRKYEKFTYVIPQMLADGYGCGHGITIYDVTNPCAPEFISELKTPPHFGGPDTWLVYTDGNQIVFADSMNGVFVVSIDDVKNPRFVNRYKLPILKRQRVTPPSIQVQTVSVTGAALVNGFLCTASEGCGVHVLKPDRRMQKFIPQSIDVDMKSSKAKVNAFYSSCGHIHAFVWYNDKIYCAAGNSGIEILDKSGNLLSTKVTRGICRDIILYKDKLVTAESNGGIAVYNTDDALTEYCRILEGEFPIRQIIKTNDGIAAVCGTSKILFFGEQNCKFTLCAEQVIQGILYHRHLMPAPNGEGVVANPLSTGPTVLTCKDGEIQKNIVYMDRFCPFADGACGYKDKLISVRRGLYFVADAPYLKSEGRRIDGLSFDGQPFALGESIVLLNRYTGGVEVLDMSNPDEPRQEKLIKLDSYPEFCGIIDGEMYVACGLDGIVKV